MDLSQVFDATRQGRPYLGKETDDEHLCRRPFSKRFHLDYYVLPATHTHISNWSFLSCSVVVSTDAGIKARYIRRYAKHLLFSSMSTTAKHLKIKAKMLLFIFFASAAALSAFFLSDGCFPYTWITVYSENRKTNIKKEEVCFCQQV